MSLSIHPSITLSRVIEAVERGNNTMDNPGLCVACGEEADGCEPDATAYSCESCGANGVYGAEELLLMLAVATRSIKKCPSRKPIKPPLTASYKLRR